MCGLVVLCLLLGTALPASANTVTVTGSGYAGKDTDGLSIIADIFSAFSAAPGGPRLSRNGCSWHSDNAFLGLSPFFLVSLHLTPSDEQLRRLNMPRLGHRLLWCTALFVGVVVTPLTVQANSVTIFDTFGPGHSRDISAGFGVGSPNG